MNINTDLYDDKNRLLNKLYDYYDKLKADLKRDWQSQITKAKYKARCQATGTLECTNGHKLKDSITCGGSCNGNLYWVDGETHYSICDKCQNVSLLEGLVCGKCGGSVRCEPKFCRYKPG